MKKQSGITLIELLVAIIITGIMAAVAVPNFGTMMQGSRLKTSYNTFVGVLSTARAEAVNRATPITVCVSTDRSTCSTSKNWADGYLAFLDANRNAARDTDEEILRYEPPVTGITITSSTYESSISIVARGRLKSEGTFVFCSGAGAQKAKALNVWVTGLGRLATDNDGNDGIVEGVDRVNVTCP